ncbi:MAG: hypothetical protein BJ554DRAFT_3393 [Olpidium bornovanus]|uniref:Uncharacterized protein n=1 Tax=Olpidium bornovanus TaxID=278681 RepID=A0A8H7ZP66_9FUNG|nr:MAG: hypothetical protein BJ554DRAFT_3393 [Olpidium bornovanus]
MLPSGRRSPSYRRRRHLKHVLTELGGAGPSDPAGDRAALQLICDYRVAEDEAAQGAENEAAEDAAVEDETEEERAVRLLRRRPLKWDSFIAARLKTFLDLVEIIITDIAEAFSLAEVAGGDEMSEAAGDDEFPARPVRLRPRLAPIWLPPYPDVPDGAGDRNADINKWLLLNRRGIHRMRMLTDRPPRDNLKSLLLTPFVEPKGAFLARARLMFWILLKMRTLAAGAAPPGTAIPPVRFVGRLRDLGVPDGWLEALETGGGVGLDLENDLPAPFRIPAAAAGWLAASAHVLCESLREEALRCCSGPGAPGLDPALWRERVFDLNDLLLTLVFSATDDEDYPRFYKYTSYALKMRRLLADPPETDAEFRAKHSDPFSRSRRLMSEETSNILHWQ